MPLHGDDLALGLLAVEQGKMGGFHIVGQLLFQQERGHLQRRFTQARRQAEGVKRAVAGRDQHPGWIMRRQRRERAGVVSRPPAAGFVMRIAGGEELPVQRRLPGGEAHDQHGLGGSVKLIHQPP